MSGFLFSPYGRISRKVYWLNWILPRIGISIFVTLLDYALFPLDPTTGEPAPVFQGITALALFWPSIALTTKRLHDRGMTGWWNAAPLMLVVGLAFAAYRYYTTKMQAGVGPAATAADGSSPVATGLMLVVFLIGAIVVLYPAVQVLFLRGQAGPNKYGDDPLGNAAEVFA